MSAWPPLEELLPHRRPMLLLDEILQWDGSSARCLATIDEDHPFLRDHAAPSVLLLEIMAQTAGVAASLGRREQRTDHCATGSTGDAPHVGMIVRVAQMEVTTDRLLEGDRIITTARCEATAHALGIFEATASRVAPTGDCEIARATVSVYQPSQ